MSGTPSRSHTRPINGNSNGGDTPSNSTSSSSRYSTPTLQHDAIRRLRGDRRTSSLQRDHQFDAGNVYSTPRSSSGGRSSIGNQQDPFVSSSPSGINRTPIQGTPSKRKGGVRIIKSSSTKSWYQRLLALPKDIYDRYELQFNEALLTDLDQLDDYAYSLGIATLGLHFLLRITISASSTFTSSSDTASSSSPYSRGSSKVVKYASSAEAKLAELRKQAQGSLITWAGLRSFIARCTTVLCWSLVLLSLFNAYWLFSHRRKYRLFLREDPVNSPNARRVQMDSPGPVTREDDESNEDDQLSESKRTTSIWKRLFWNCWGLAKGSSKSTARQEVQELSVWTPPTFGLRFFAVYSPPIALLIQFINRNNFFVFVTASSLLSIQTFMIVRSFVQLLQDRQTINREVMSEYNTKFVAPRIHYARKDASTMTNEAEMFDYRDYSRKSASRGRHSIAVPSSPYY